MKKLLPILFTLFTSVAFAQSVTITSGTAGTIQLPRLSYEQINAIPNPKAGMMVFDSTFKCLKYYNGSKWLCSSQNEGSNVAVGFAWKHINNSYLGSDVPSRIYVNQSNEVYMAGQHTGGYMTPVVAKYSSTGNLLWKFHESGLYNITGSSSILTDANNNTFALFNWHWAGYTRAVIFKLLPNGTLELQRGLSAPSGSVIGEKIFLDNNQDLYVTGTFFGTITTDVATISSTNGGAFLAKYSNQGVIQWIRNLPASVKGFSSNGDAYFAGYFENSVLMDGNPYYSYGGYDMIFGKLNGNGQSLWVKHVGGSGNDKITDASIDGNGNLYAIGSFSNTVSFDGNNASAVNAEDFVAMKYNTDGVFRWVRNGGGTGKDEGVKLQLSYDNHLVISGMASSNSVSFYPNITINPATSPSNFLIKYNGENGDIIWVKPNETSNNFKVKNDGTVYTWTNVGTGDIYFPERDHIITKYLENGELAYRLINGGLALDIGFGTDNHFFVTGNFKNTVQIGGSNLTCTDTYGDIFISHWME